MEALCLLGTFQLQLRQGGRWGEREDAVKIKYNLHHRLDCCDSH